MIYKIIYAGLVTEALIFAIFSAAPLMKPRAWLIKKTPLLYNDARKQHLLECPACTGFYVSVAVWSATSLMESGALMWFFNLMLAYRLFTITKDTFTIIFNFAINLIMWRSKK